MGKGGSASVKARSLLAETIPQNDGPITKKTIRECIPPEYFVRSYVHSLGALCWDLTMAGMAFLAVHWCNENLPAMAVPFAWLAYWWFQGLVFTGLWVIGHECGHGGFTDSRLVNDAVGFVVHSALLAPYFSWAITHAKHHHYTNHMTMGETWVPSTANPEKKSVKFAKTNAGVIQRLTIIATVGWWAYLINNNTGARQNLGQSHFDPNAKQLFKKKDKNYVRASNVGMVVAGIVIAYAVSIFGFWPVVRSYFIPQMEANFYLAIITLLQHTHEDVPHFEDEQWTWLRGALSTIDRDMGPTANYLTHYITSSHVCHHIFSDMPYYGAEAATPYVKAHLGKYYKAVPATPVMGSTYLGYLKQLWVCLQTTVSVGPEDGNDFLWFK